MDENYDFEISASVVSSEVESPAQGVVEVPVRRRYWSWGFAPPLVIAAIASVLLVFRAQIRPRIAPWVDALFSVHSAELQIRDAAPSKIAFQHPRFVWTEPDVIRAPQVTPKNLRDPLVANDRTESLAPENAESNPASASDTPRTPRIPTPCRFPRRLIVMRTNISLRRSRRARDSA